MRIIPVLDLKEGEVVQARGGHRDAYRPIVTPLSSSSDSVSVAHGLLTLHPFSTFYIADLDAIEKSSPNAGALESLKSMPNAPELWLDAGFSQEMDVTAALQEPDVRPVLGSESQHNDFLLRRFGRHPDFILSLDFSADGFLGPAEILAASDHWPQTVIVMTLRKVGSGTGPDFERLAEIQRRAGNRHIIAAGGVRDETDLLKLAELGVAGVLIATALHQGALTSSQLARWEDG